MGGRRARGGELGGAQDLISTDVTTVDDVAPIAETMSIPILATDQPLRLAVERAELEGAMEARVEGRGGRQ